MRNIAFAFLTLGVWFAVIPSLAAPFNPSMTVDQVAENASTADIAVAASQTTPPKQNFGTKSGYIPGHVRTPYGWADCIGWWHRHANGVLHCHGQLVIERR